MFLLVRWKNLRILMFCVLIALACCAIIALPLRRRDAAPAVNPAAGRQTLIIDPGHGGEDGGASSATGLVESAVNWDIARRLCELAGFFGVEAVMTRDSEDIDYPDTAKTTHARKVWDTQQRVARINAVPFGVLISIHQNKYPGPQPCGSQVLYAKDAVSKAFGELTHANLVNGLNPGNRRVASPIGGDIYLMKHTSCTAILVECGFLSNPSEAELLGTDGYRRKLAALLLGSYIQFSNTPSEVLHEG
jgi:N-acetylmuramoyl-L-alanine amidase